MSFISMFGHRRYDTIFSSFAAIVLHISITLPRRHHTAHILRIRTMSAEQWETVMMIKYSSQFVRYEMEIWIKQYNESDNNIMKWVHSAWLRYIEEKNIFDNLSRLCHKIGLCVHRIIACNIDPIRVCISHFFAAITSSLFCQIRRIVSSDANPNYTEVVATVFHSHKC